jgi:hypothetical protein
MYLLKLIPNLLCLMIGENVQGQSSLPNFKPILESTGSCNSLLNQPLLLLFFFCEYFLFYFMKIFTVNGFIFFFFFFFG